MYVNKTAFGLNTSYHTILPGSGLTILEHSCSASLLLKALGLAVPFSYNTPQSYLQAFSLPPSHLCVQ